METKYVRVPFEVELAKEITNGSKEGKIVTEDGRPVKIVYFSDVKTNSYNVLYIVNAGEDGECCYWAERNGSSEDETADLMLEIPEYMTFKDGDLYTTIKGGVGIYNSSYKSARGTIPFYVGIRNDGELIFWPNDYSGFGCITESRLSTEEEKQQLIDALKESKEPKAKEYLKRFFGIEGKPKYEFKPFDKVLVRCNDKCQWGARLFDRMFEGDYACTDSLTYKQCIPYNEHTAHLLGTTDNYQ